MTSVHVVGTLKFVYPGHSCIQRKPSLGRPIGKLAVLFLPTSNSHRTEHFAQKLKIDVKISLTGTKVEGNLRIGASANHPTFKMCDKRPSKDQLRKKGKPCQSLNVNVHEMFIFVIAKQ